jgi:BirA family biotin operon repressor/biotin-[acetyl-CoA-carboxylase] ligase
MLIIPVSSISELSSERINKLLITKTFGRQLVVVDECASTFDIAEQFALSGASHGLTVIAARQLQGRGRFGRNWLSPPGGLWMTVVLRNPNLSSFVGGISLLGALSAALAINKMFEIRSLVKWPNDLVIRSDKVGGILVESKFEGNEHLYSLLGIGLNVNFQPSMIRSVNQKSTTLLCELNNPVDINALASATLKEIEDMFDLTAQNRISDTLEILRATDFSVGRKVKVTMPSRTVEGIFHEYLSLTQAEIETNGEYVIVETGTVIDVEYLL